MATEGLLLAIESLKASDSPFTFTFSFERHAFILRPERRGQQPWREVLRKLGVSRGNPGWEKGFERGMVANGKMVGVNFDFGVDVGNTFDRWARLLAYVPF
jgi:hypothetical protein